jgi:hypothetical protein
MKSILKIQAIIFILLTVISLISVGNIWLPLMAVLSFIVGPIMAYSHPKEMQDYIIITLLFILALVLMFYGMRKKESNRGISTFIIGFWLWVVVGLFTGLSTGT